MFVKRLMDRKQFRRFNRLTALAWMVVAVVAFTTVPVTNATAATKKVTRCKTVQRKRTCKQIRVRIKPIPPTVNTTKSAPPTSPTASAPVDGGLTTIPATAAQTPVVVSPVGVVVVTPVPVQPAANPVPIAAAPAAPPQAPPATQPTITPPTVSVVPVTAAPLPATPAPKSTPSTPSTPTNATLGMVHKIGDAPIDDYPVALKNAAQGSTFDALRFPNRECTSFVALRVAADGRPLDSFFYQPTTTWAERAAQAGYAVDGTPRPGDIAHWVANEKQTFPDGSWTQAGPVGHVGYVAAVNADGTITLEDYNGANVRGTYSVRYNTRAPRYIHYKN